MRRHRKSPFGDAPMSETDALELSTHEFTLAPGHRLRASRCLICAALIGGMPVRAVTIVLLSADYCPCGNLEPDGYLVCAGHGEQRPGVLAQLVAMRAASVEAHGLEPSC
jgi:hypothetical protein